MKRLSSTRWRRAPIPPILISSSARLPVTVISDLLRLGGRVGRAVGSGAGRRLAALIGGGPEHGLDDVLVAGAAAQVARQREAHLVLGRVGVGVQQGPGRQHHARRAEPALEAVLARETLLHGVELAGGAQPLDGLYGVTVR